MQLQRCSACALLLPGGWEARTAHASMRMWSSRCCWSRGEDKSLNRYTLAASAWHPQQAASSQWEGPCSLAPALMLVAPLLRQNCWSILQAAHARAPAPPTITSVAVDPGELPPHCWSSRQLPVQACWTHDAQQQALQVAMYMPLQQQGGTAANRCNTMAYGINGLPCCLQGLFTQASGRLAEFLAGHQEGRRVISCNSYYTQPQAKHLLSALLALCFVIGRSWSCWHSFQSYFQTCMDG